MVFGFGNTPAPQGQSPFGGGQSPFSTPQQPTTGGFGFGQQPQQQQQQTGGFGFGGGTGGGFGFGGTQQQQQQQQQTGLGVGGFGSPPKQNTTGGTGFGFGGGGTGGGFGFGQPQQQQQQYNQAGHQQSITGQYLLQWDNAYNAMHPDCKFRTFLYNMCTPGQSEQAVLRERTRGGAGVKEEQWIQAKRHNPDPEKMYPCPTHFMVGLKYRVEKQKGTIELYHKHLGNISSQVSELKAIQERNAAKYKKLVLDQIMAERKLLAVVAKVEVMRQHGLRLGPEQHTVLDRTNKLLNEITAPNKFKALHLELQSGLEAKQRKSRAVSKVVSGSSDVASGPAGKQRLVTSHGTVDTNVLRDWAKFLDRMTSGLHALQQTLAKDLEDIAAATERTSDLQRGHGNW